jgi:sigma-B regulation protein RsbU (phosphoserine phosphatase)
MQFVISDAGKPFDHTKQKNVDINLPAEKRPIGGLGIFLVRQIMDTVTYERVEGRNILTLRKKFK